jgi:hypothetical protein
MGDGLLGAGRILEGIQPRFCLCLEHLNIQGVAMPTRAYTGDAISRYYQFHPCLLQVRPMALRVATGYVHGVLITVKDIITSERKASRAR